MTIFNYDIFNELFNTAVLMGIGTGVISGTFCFLTGYGVYKAFSLINIHNYN